MKLFLVKNLAFRCFSVGQHGERIQETNLKINVGKTHNRMDFYWIYARKISSSNGKCVHAEKYIKIEYSYCKLL